MLEPQVMCVQELALEAEIAPDAVAGVAGNREVDRGQVHTDLVRPPCL